MKWEYRTAALYLDNQGKQFDQSLRELNELGAEGWEAVVAHPATAMVRATVLLKRRID